jgi:hypothetical protein
MEKATEETISSQNGSLVEDMGSCSPIDRVPSLSKRPRDEEDELDKQKELEANGKRTKLEEEPQVNGSAEINEESTQIQKEDQSKSESADAAISPALRCSVEPTDEEPVAGDDAAVSTATEDQNPNGIPAARSGMANGGRWRTHQMAEDYVDAVGKLVYPGTRFRPYGYDTVNREYPLEHISVLAFLKSPLRRPSIIEKWSPYEVSVFEGSLLHYGKEFHLVSREIKTKSTKEVIDFYYIWKKTAHYKKWKEQYMSDLDLELALDPQHPTTPGKS